MLMWLLLGQRLCSALHVAWFILAMTQQGDDCFELQFRGEERDSGWESDLPKVTQSVKLGAEPHQSDPLLSHHAACRNQFINDGH